jgi:hypothetical protein
MLPLHYEQLVAEYRRIDLLREAQEQRLVDQTHRSWAVRTLWRTVLYPVCELSLPVLEPACTAQPA